MARQQILFDTALAKAKEIFDPATCVALVAIYNNQSGACEVLTTLRKGEILRFLDDVRTTVTAGEWRSGDEQPH